MASFTKGDFRRHWLEKRLTKQLGEAWVKELPLLTDSIMTQLEQFKGTYSFSTDPLTFNWASFEHNVQTNLKKIMDKFFKDIITLGLREGLENPKIKIAGEEVNLQFNSFMSQSRAIHWLHYLLRAYHEDYQSLLTSLNNQLMINPASVNQITRADIKTYLVERAIARFNRYYSSISVEMQSAINSARESIYRKRDPENLFLYRWGIRRDNRTTEQCLEIDRRVKERMRETKKIGVELDWLKALINQVAVEYDPKWIVRDWAPHYRCRSVLKRAVV